MRARTLAPALVTGSIIGLALASRLAAQTAASQPAASRPARHPLPKLAPEAGLSYEVRDGDTGELIPVKITLVGVAGTPDPKLTANDIGRQEGDAIAAYNRVMSATGIGVARVPIGTYDVYFSRGPEWDIASTKGLKLELAGAEVRGELHHVVDSTGWISADFHVHAASSVDSRVPMIDRVYEFVSDGVEVLTSTDHNVVTDYGPYIADVGVGRYLMSVIGDELTTGGWGHMGAWPLPQDLEGAGHGAVLVRGRSAKDIFETVRTRAPDAVIDIHHPRMDNEIGYFNRGRLDAKSDSAAKPGFSFDFDAVEVLNGYQDNERKPVDRLISDWFNLLNHGHIVTALGNSDSHHLHYNVGGYPRNYIFVMDDEPDKVTPLAIAREVKAHHVFFTTGPFVSLRSGGAIVGDTIPAPGGKAHVDVTVQAPAWISVSTVRLFVNGAEVKKWDTPATTDVVRLQAGFDVEVPRDSWVVARVDGDKSMLPIVGDKGKFTVVPFALTNPIFLDVDGNGVYDPMLPHGPHAPPPGTPFKEPPASAPTSSVTPL